MAGTGYTYFADVILPKELPSPPMMPGLDSLASLWSWEIEATLHYCWGFARYQQLVPPQVSMPDAEPPCCDVSRSRSPLEVVEPPSPMSRRVTRVPRPIPCLRQDDDVRAGNQVELMETERQGVLSTQIKTTMDDYIRERRAKGIE